MAGNSQKFIARNRAPRVQIEYDVELYGAEKKVQLPFVMGVMSDLSGKSKVEQPAVADRKFLEIDVDNFDDRMKSMAPRAAFTVPNTLTGEGSLAVDLVFEKMSDFSPAAIAAKVEPLRALLEARTQLANLMTYMDGKSGAEALIEKILADPTLLGAISTMPAADPTADAALDSLRGVVTPEPEADTTGDVLASLRSIEISETPSEDSSSALDSIRSAHVPEAEVDTTDDALTSLRSIETPEAPEEDDTAALNSLLAVDIPEPEADTSEDTLTSLRSIEIAETPSEDNTSALETLRSADLPAPEADTTDDTLTSLRSIETPEAPKEDNTSALDSLLSVDLPEPEADTTDDTLTSLRSIEIAETPSEDSSSALDSLLSVDIPEAEADTSEDTLASLRGIEIAETPSEDSSSALDSLLSADVPEAEVDTTDDALTSLRSIETPEAPEEDDTSALDSLLAVDIPEAEVDTSEYTLTSLRGIEIAETPSEDSSSALDSLLSVDVPEAEVDTTHDTLTSLRSIETPEAPEDDDASALDSLLAVDIPEPEADTSDDTLTSLRSIETPEAPEEDDTSALDSLLSADVPEAEADTSEETLTSLRSIETPEAPEEDDASALDSLLSADLPEPEADTSEDTLTSLRSIKTPEAPEDDDASALDSLLAVDIPEAEADTSDDTLTSLRSIETPEAPEEDDTSALDSLLAVDIPEPEADTSDDALDSLLGMEGAAMQKDAADTLDDPRDIETEQTSELLSADTLDGLLGNLADPEPEPEPEPLIADPLDDLLGDLADPEPQPEQEPPATDTLDDLLGNFADPEPQPEPEPPIANPLDDLLGDLAEPEPQTEPTAPPADALDDLLGNLAEPEPQPEPEPPAADPLDDLLGDLAEPEPQSEPEPPANDDLDDLLGDLTAGAPGETEATAQMTEDLNFDFGVLSGERPDAARLRRKRFRMAIFGDFSGRAARGLIETGDALAARKPILLDPDTAEEVIEGFKTTLVLPVGKDGAGVEVTLKGLDSLHPDELYENVALFAELVGLKQQLGMGATAQKAAARLQEWSEKHGTYAAPAKLKSGGNSVPANLRMTDFQKLIGDTSGALAQASPIEELMARIVGPHIRAVPGADQKAMQKAVDESLSAAMRLVLHHPEFQSLESQWRSIDLIARSVETDDTLDVILYDISAEEIAADLASAPDLAQSGLVRLLTGEPLDEENGRGGYSALLGLYTFEETPPHAELLSLVARAAAHVDAPFFAAMAPGFMEVAREDRHPLTARAWDDLRAMNEAQYLGLVTPRFLLRRPYGEKTEPCYEFDFEEFTMSEGLGGMLWANPVVLVAILLARSFRQFGKSMQLGKVMSLGGMPYHFVTDRHGDQVALPCTERNLTLSTVETVMARGFMPVVSVKGRDEVRLASFQSMGGGEIRGPWTGEPPPTATAPRKMTQPAPQQKEQAGDDDLDALLAGFGDTDPAPAGDVDADLAALLDGL